MMTGHTLPCGSLCRATNRPSRLLQQKRNKNRRLARPLPAGDVPAFSQRLCLIKVGRVSTGLSCLSPQPRGTWRSPRPVSDVPGGGAVRSGAGAVEGGGRQQEKDEPSTAGGGGIVDDSGTTRRETSSSRPASRPGVPASCPR